MAPRYSSRLQAQIAEAEAGFLLFQSLLENRFVPAFRFVHLGAVLEQEGHIRDGRE